MTITIRELFFSNRGSNIRIINECKRKKYISSNVPKLKKSYVLTGLYKKNCLMFRWPIMNLNSLKVLCLKLVKSICFLPIKNCQSSIVIISGLTPLSEIKKVSLDNIDFLTNLGEDTNKHKLEYESIS